MNIQAITVINQSHLNHLLKEINVDKAAIDIMSAKAVSQVIRIKKVPSWIANILKQEMLSLNADVAVNRDAITGRAKFSDCLVMGNLSQLNRFVEKLEKQPASLKKISGQIKNLLENYARQEFILLLKNSQMKLGRRTKLMAIVNLTPDSFSGDGLWGKVDLDFIYRHIDGLVKDGADIIDIGGESTRPGAKPVSLKDEINRTIPVIKKIAKKINLPLSIDTYKPEVARMALDCGASIVNNVMGVQNNPKMLKVIKKERAAVVLMHIKGKPQTMQKKPCYQDLMGEILESLKKSMDIAVSFGINPEKIIVDPGIGFAKTKEQNLEIIRRLAELRSLGRPILIGPSRKSFIGKILNLEPQERLMGTAAAVVTSIVNGANIVRVHDCRAIKQVVKITNSILYN
ncbi:MAG: dihydropteroate synthase [Candidatus Omnitrophota bacterium]|nr:dihydropteroate synthase [Candidatus Omnitrophota bacterium]